MDNPKNNNKSNAQAIQLFISRILGDPAWPELLRALRGYDATAKAKGPPIEVKSNKEKASVKIEFDTKLYRPLRIRIKTFNSRYTENHLERRKHREFCCRHGLQRSRKFLASLWLDKAVNPKERRLVAGQGNSQRVSRIFASIDLGGALCGEDSPQVLALYNGTDNHWHLYDMDGDVLPLVRKQPVGFTKRGNILIGNYIIIQRRGSEGELGTSSEDIDHPSNNVQIKMRMRNFYNEMKPLVKTKLAKRR